MKTYYDRRAHEYDDWYLGVGLYSARERPAWDEEVGALALALEALAPARTLDIACGTGFVTRHLRGEIVGLDQSDTMLDVARVQAPNATYIAGDALALPFEDDSFDRVFTGHFYGHLEDADRVRFLAEARRVGRELVVCDSVLRDGVERVERQERELKDGSRWEVYKRYFTPDELEEELGGGRTLFGGRWFVVVASP